MRYIIGLCLATAAPVVGAALPAGMSGSWYNPVQAGHGIHLEMTGAASAIGTWDVFDASGAPLHLYFEGNVVGDSIIATAYDTRGMRFGSFRPTDLQVERWGSLLFEFSSCNQGRLSWNANGPGGGAGYGTGETALVRHTAIHGLGCNFTGEQNVSVHAGSYEGRWDRPTSGPELRPWRVRAALDNEGRMYAAAMWAPGTGFVAGFSPPPVFMGEPVNAFGEASVAVRYSLATMFGSGSAPSPHVVVAPLQFNRLGPALTTATMASGERPDLFSTLELTRNADQPDPIAAVGFDPRSLEGKQFEFVAETQFFSLKDTIDVLPGPVFCLRAAFHTPDACTMRVSVGSVEDGLSMFEIQAVSILVPGEVYDGKGWIRSDTGELVLVGSAGNRGLGIVARPKP